MSTAENAKGEEEKQRGVEFKFPLLIVRTQAFMSLYERLGSLRATRLISWASLIGMPFVAGFGLYLISKALLTLITIPEAREAGRQLGPQAYILLPGVNPFLPILYGWIGIVVAIAVHEGAHGVIGRHIGFRVKSSGLLFLTVIPIGAFVDVDEEQLEEAEAKDSVRVFAAGHGANVAVALICIIGVLAITSGLNPVIDGLYVVEVAEGMPAEDAGLLIGDVIVRIDDMRVNTIEALKAALEDKRPGDVVQLTFMRGEMWEDRFFARIKLTEYDGKAAIGVTLVEMLIEQRLRVYQRLATENPFIHFIPPTLTQGLVPFSDALHAFYTHDLGESWHILTNILFWMWFINVNVAIFNALPIYPLDGGRAFKKFLESLLGRKPKDSMVYRLTSAVTVAIIAALVMMMLLPYIV